MGKKVAVIGAHGFIGRNLCAAILCENKSIELTQVTRTNFESASEDEYDIVVNAACNSDRNLATVDPHKDFIESCTLTSSIIHNYRFDRFIHISSTLATSYSAGTYGKNKRLAEELVWFHIRGNATLLRPSLVLGPHMKKGLVYDLMKGTPIRKSLGSKLQLCPVSLISATVLTLIAHPAPASIYTLGSQDTITVQRMAQVIGKGPLSRTNQMESNFSEPNQAELGMVDFTALDVLMGYLKDERSRRED